MILILFIIHVLLTQDMLLYLCSIDFDKDQQFFAVGGVTRQLKVYDYQSVVSRPVSVHYPVQDLACASKIR